MSYSYDRRTAARTWDPSVLGLSKSDLARMDAEEREEALTDSINRAADLCDAITIAFHDDLEQGDRRQLAQSAKALQGIARSV